MSAFRERRAVLCVGGCGFFGRPETSDLCSMCYRSVFLMEAGLQASSAPSGEDGCAAAKGGRCNRCRVGTNVKGSGFMRCQCGGTFCSAHRRASDHECAFNLRAAGPEADAELAYMERLDRAKSQRI